MDYHFEAIPQRKIERYNSVLYSLSNIKQARLWQNSAWTSHKTFDARFLWQECQNSLTFPKPGENRSVYE